MTILRTRPTAVLAALLLAGAMALPALAQETHGVEVVDSEYIPETLEVTVGDTVEWEHLGSFPHTVTADDGSFDSSPDCTDGGDCMTNGETFSVTFDEPGEYPYYCKIHGGPGGSGMSGTIVVTAAADGGDTAGDTGDSTGGSGDSGSTAPETTGSLTASDQSGNGAEVTVDSVTISGASGFIVVHADDDGAPGAVLGHRAIPEGTSTDVAVDLDTPLSESAAVWPMLHFDAGEVGAYEFPGPDAPVMADGAIVMQQVTFTVEAAQGDSLPRTGIPFLPLAAGGLAVLAVGGGILRHRRLLS